MIWSVEYWQQFCFWEVYNHTWMNMKMTNLENFENAYLEFKDFQAAHFCFHRARKRIVKILG